MKDGASWRHICVDMQRMFAEDTPWHVPWLHRVLPQVEEVASRHSDKTIFTRFVPPARPEDATGAWQDYYRKWQAMTRENLPDEMIDLIGPLKRLVPPARVIDKPVYSPWFDGSLTRFLMRETVDTLVVTGGETDVCVLATVLGAIDLGFDVVVLKDAVCSGADTTHDAAINLLADRFSVQLELLSTEEFLAQATAIRI
jgi:nicotinamidase-related amidase